MPVVPHPCRLLAAVFLFAPVGAVQAAEPLRYDCDLMARDIGPPVTGMTAAPDNGWQNGPDEARLICSWYSGPAVKAATEQVLNREDYKDVGVLTAQLAVYDSPLARRDAEWMNAAFDVPEF